MARYRFNKKVRSNYRNKYENIDIRKVEYSHIDIALYKHRNKALYPYMTICLYKNIDI